MSLRPKVAGPVPKPGACSLAAHLCLRTGWRAAVTLLPKNKDMFRKSGPTPSLDARAGIAVLAAGAALWSTAHVEFSKRNVVDGATCPKRVCTLSKPTSQLDSTAAVHPYHPKPEEIAGNQELDRQLELDLQWEREQALLEDLRRGEELERKSEHEEIQGRKAALQKTAGLSKQEMDRIESVIAKLENRLRRINFQLYRSLATFHPDPDDPMKQRPLAQPSAVPEKRANFLQARAYLRAQTKFEAILGGRRLSAPDVPSTDIEDYVQWTRVNRE